MAAETGDSPEQNAPADLAAARKLDGVRLFLRQVTNDRQLEHQSLIGFDQQDDPDDEGPEPYDHVQRESDKNQPGHKTNDGQTNPDSNHGHAKEDHLKGMEPHKAALVIRLHHQKNDRR